MNKYSINIIYVLIMVATIIIVDIFKFRNQFWERLIVNISIVLVYLTFYFIFIKTH